MKKIRLLIVIVVFPFLLYSQDYKTSLGLRGSWFWGLTIKHFVNNDLATEFLLTGYGYGYYSGFHLTGMVEKHFEAFDEDNLKWYIGGGGSIGQFSYKFLRNTWDNYFTFGLCGIIGLEYTFTEAPLNISVDWKPSLYFGGDLEDIFWPNNVALSIRYILKK